MAVFGSLLKAIWKAKVGPHEGTAQSIAVERGEHIRSCQVTYIVVSCLLFLPTFTLQSSMSKSV